MLGVKTITIFCTSGSDMTNKNNTSFNVLKNERRQGNHIKTDPTQTCCEDVHRI
jgi:hypothetical protein